MNVSSEKDLAVLIHKVYQTHSYGKVMKNDDLSEIAWKEATKQWPSVYNSIQRINGSGYTRGSTVKISFSMGQLDAYFSDVVVYTKL